MGKDFFPHLEPCQASGDQLLLLTTDGVHYLTENSDIVARILQAAADPGIVARRLVDLAKWCGGLDNATVAIVPGTVSIDRSSLDDLHALQVWDAFGELQIELGHIPENVRGNDRNFSEAARRTDERGSDVEGAQLFETTRPTTREAASVPSSGIADPKPKAAKSRNRKPKKPKEQEKPVPPQLDIKFSSKPE